MNKMKKFLAGFMASVLLFFNVPAFAASSSNASNKNTYMKLEKSAITEYVKALEKTDLGVLQKFIEKNNQDMSSEVGIEVKLPLIKTRKYVITNNEPYNEKYEDASIKAFVDGEEVANLNIVANGNNMSLQIPELFDNYFTLDMGNLKELFEKLEIDLDEDEIPTGLYYPCEMREALKLTKNEEKIVKDAKKKYSKLLDKEFLKNEFFSKEKSEELDINGIKYKTDVVKYEISNKDIFSGMKNIWTEFKNDKTLLDLIWSKFEKVYELNKRTNPQLEKITKEEIISTIDEYFEDMEDYVMSEDSYLISKLYYQKNKIIKRDIIEEDRGYEDENTLTIYTVKDKNQEYYALVIDELKLEDKVNRANKDITHNFIATTIRNHYDFVDGEFVVEKTEEENKATLRLSQINNNEYKYEFSIVDSKPVNGIEQYLDVDGKWVDARDSSANTITGTYKKAKVTSKEYESSFEINIPVEDQGTVTLIIDSKYKKVNKINKIDTTKNEKVLNKMSKEEIVGIFENNKDMIMEKLEGKFGTAFYYDVYMQSMAALQDRMQVRADKATAAQIGKATRIWLVDYTSDPYFKSSVTKGLESNSWIKYRDIDEIDGYVDSNLKSANGGEYYIGLKGDINSYNSKIVVAISKDGTDLPNLSDIVEIAPAGEEYGVMYIEPY